MEERFWRLKRLEERFGRLRSWGSWGSRRSVNIEGELEKRFRRLRRESKREVGIVGKVLGEGRREKGEGRREK